jgi:Na+-transporting methylmalonyl-CoA/oxaloacetate decarboxylase gamma subunit
MEASVSAALSVSALAMAVIFTVLIILIFTIKVLVKLIPYKAPAAAQPARKVASSAAPEQDYQIAAISASLAAHMEKRPDEFRIVNIQSR